MASSPEPPDFAQPYVLTRLQTLLLSTSDLDTFLTDLAQISTYAVSAQVSCGITVRYDVSVMTVGSSDGLAELLDESQYHAGDGPCLESLRTGMIIDVPDMRDERRWPAYTKAALEIGLQCSVSFPLAVDGVTLGALNLYGFERPHLFGADERRQVELFAAQAAGTLRVATRQMKDTVLLAQMEEALQSRTVIDQALGIIMAQHGCTAGVAFELIRRQSQNSHRRLRDIAADLIIRVSQQPPEPGRPFDLT